MTPGLNIEDGNVGLCSHCSHLSIIHFHGHHIEVMHCYDTHLYQQVFLTNSLHSISFFMTTVTENKFG